MKHSPINNVLADTISGEWGVEPEDESGVKIIRTANFTNLGIIDFANIVLRKIEPKKIQQKKLITGDVIIEKSGGSPTQPVGRVVYFENPDNSTYLCNNFTTVLRPDKSVVFPKFLFYVLFYNHLTKKTLRFQNKTTGIINVKLENYLNSKIPLPPLDDQIRIATVLTRAERLIAKRKESIKALDELLKSTFLEIFGDPSKAKPTNNVKTIEEVCQFKGGGTPSKAKPEYFTGDILWVSPKDMKSLYINTSIDKITNDAIENSSTTLIPKGSILMVIRSGILKNKLPVAINTVDVTINQDMKALTSKKLLASYLLYFFISSERYMLKKVRATTADNFNFDDIRKMKIIIPPLPLQNQFAAIVEKVESIKAKQTQSLAALENLYASLSQRAFKGELDLRRVPVVYVEAEPLETKGTISADVKVTKAFSKDELINILKAKAVR